MQHVDSSGIVVTYSLSGSGDPRGHQSMTYAAVAKRLAELLGHEFGGEYSAGGRHSGRVYFVPNDTLVGSATVRDLGIHTEDDFFGGTVPYRFIGTKSITHPLVDAAADAPEGWSKNFCSVVRGAVLAGYSAFSPRDARRAARELLKQGPVRVKSTLGIGGRGQAVVTTAAEADDAIDVETDNLSQCGVVLEQNLSDVLTYSVGRVQVAQQVATYVGMQKLTTGHDGAQVYGGSDLLVARGDFDALLALDLPAEAQTAVAHARTYDAAASACFPGFLASRRNYDIAAGKDAAGERRCGVLEQSWRIGGASSAEVAALETFRSDPKARAVRASCTEVYGEATPPPGAIVFFDGVDDTVGRMLKYTVVERHVDPR